MSTALRLVVRRGVELAPPGRSVAIVSGGNMARPLKVTVRYAGDAYHAAVPGDERADQLLLRSLHHFGIDPNEKAAWRLKHGGENRVEHGLFLDHAIGEQVRDGGELVLEQRVSGNRHLSTGSY